MVVGADGHVMAILYNRQTEVSGRVVPGYVPPSRIPIPDRLRRTRNMTYHGGAVQTAPKIYVVFWGSEWNGSGDPDGVMNYYTQFISGVGGSSWMNTVAQYTQSNGQHVGNASGSYAGSWVDTTDPRPNLNTSSYQTAFATEAAHAAAHFGNGTASADYVIAIPHGVPVYQFAGNYGGSNGYCAWHSDTSASIAYTNLPYIPDAGYSCGVGSVNNPGINDGVSIVGGHEQAEAETDPELNAWYDSSGAEIGDKCAWTGLANESFSTGTFPTQPLWSNAVSGCVQ